ncbi:DNA nickase [Legionella birminghamensis]|uniref:Alr3199 protein n=2 Tax=Legionella birminghamensis TaxID=28083 RepID=A0A378IA35_9GAMM|nr:DNA nickase [Legionella birminghamensis]STX32039.1 Alr3199 protein [Legionella birminghamensis]
MDIYDYLKMDHEKVNHLFKLFEKTSLLKRQHEIVTLISKELLVHAHSEQETFYKVLAQHPLTSDIASHGKKEHLEIEEQINIIDNAWGSEQWPEAVLKLKEIVEHHVKEEEGEIFRKAKKVISDKDAIIIKEKMHYLKGMFLVWLDKKAHEKEASVKNKMEKHPIRPASKTFISNHSRTNGPH